MRKSKDSVIDALRDAVFDTNPKQDSLMVVGTSIGVVTLSSDGSAFFSDGTPLTKEERALAVRELNEQVVNYNSHRP